jgi:hypothetical protein
MVNLTLVTLGSEIMNYHPYSPNLAPSDFHLFGPPEEHQKWHKFDTNDECKHGVLTWQNSQATSFYAAGISALS